MLDLVRFRWQNGNGAWISPTWASVTSDKDKAGIMSWVSIGRPSLQDIEIIERIPVPEDIRTTGRASLYKAYVILYYDGDKLDGEAFLARMRQIYDADWKPEAVDGRVVNRLA